MERIGSSDDDESARLPLVEGLPSDWSGLLCLANKEHRNIITNDKYKFAHVEIRLLFGL